MNVDQESKNFAAGSALVKPYIHLEEQIPLPTDDGNLRKGIAMLQSCATDSFWEAHWFLGKAFEATGNFDKSAQHFEMAYKSAQENSSVVHEFLVSLLRVKSYQKAKDVVGDLSSLDDPCLRFDSAMVYYMTGDLNDAMELLRHFDWPAKYSKRISALADRMRDRQ